MKNRKNKNNNTTNNNNENKNTSNSKRSGGYWLSLNPAKRHTEILFLFNSVFWISVLGVIVATKFYLDLGNMGNFYFNQIKNKLPLNQIFFFY